MLNYQRVSLDIDEMMLEMMVEGVDQDTSEGSVGPLVRDFHVIRIVRNWGCNQKEWGITQPKHTKTVYQMFT